MDTLSYNEKNILKTLVDEDRELTARTIRARVGLDNYNSWRKTVDKLVERMLVAHNGEPRNGRRYVPTPEGVRLLAMNTAAESKELAQVETPASPPPPVPGVDTPYLTMQVFADHTRIPIDDAVRMLDALSNGASR